MYNMLTLVSYDCPSSQMLPMSTDKFNNFHFLLLLVKQLLREFQMLVTGNFFVVITVAIPLLSLCVQAVCWRRTPLQTVSPV